MNNMNEEKYCIGCGVQIQTEDKQKAGYVPASALEKEDTICWRCFRITHYNEVSSVEMTDDDYLNILHSIGESKGLVVKIVDMFDFNGSWINGLPRFVGNKSILLVGNKVDLLPKSVNLKRMKNWMKQSAKELGLKPVDVYLCSAAKGIGIEELVSAMDHYRQGENIFVVGVTNVGKSTFINQILKRVATADEPLLTTSRFPGTTLNMIQIPLEDGQALYDTPGVINRRQMAHYISEKDYKIVFPNHTLKPKVYQLKEKQTLFFGGLARIDFVQGENQSFVCYLSNDLHIHRTKMENADELYSKHVGEMLSPPRKEQLAEWPKLVKHSFRIKKEQTDIVFSGLGWLTLKGSGAYVEAYAPEGVAVTLRKALI